MSDLIYLQQIRDYIVAPALEHLGLGGVARMRLVIGTGLVESGLKYVDQVDARGAPGPAFGLFQMERATHDDIWNHYLSSHRRQALSVRLRQLLIPGRPMVEQLHGNAFYAAAMCGVFYLRCADTLPKADDLQGMANYWKKYYNTHLGKGRAEDFVRKAAAITAL